MAKLIYSMLTSLDGDTEDEHGGFDWAAPDDEEVHSHINELASSFGNEFYGQMIVCPVVVGGGKRFLPDGIRLDLELVEERRFRKRVVVLRYAVRG
jgi:hypothetical protein